MGKRLIAAIAVLLTASAAQSMEIKTFFGHEIGITGEDPDLMLQIDGRTVLKDAIITLSEITLVAGVPTIVGERSSGGNACDGSPFVISFPDGGAPKFDGPIDSCAPVTMENKKDRLEFHTTPLPGRDGESWSWTPSDGLKALPSVAFTPDASKGWANIRERTLQHPADIFKYREIAQQLDDLLGTDKAVFESIIVGVGEGTFQGDDYVGTSCTPHMCDSTGAIIYLSTTDRKVFIAWKPDGQKIVVRPEVKQWPEKPRRELKQWAEKWK
ncbi:hypothetical protein G6K83_11295 [Agrobacterium rhizogenes]|uniref:hypothetical protein n=1 Tax=Rhizobium rhizogenes TaxID=359 RepID=UPI0015746510|nr:hypothetical protein [Rhizobium rhizogenes]NTH25657.1 hypothetical protein [Rhizobium rhizogenes]